MLRRASGVVALVVISACQAGGLAIDATSMPEAAAVTRDDATVRFGSMALDAGGLRDARVPDVDAAQVRDASARDALGAAELRSLCSGCAGERRDGSAAAARVHHIHLNVQSASEAIDFYQRFFGIEPVWLNEREVALWAEPMLPSCEPRPAA